MVVYAALNSLVAMEYVKMSNIETKTIVLTAEGAENGTPERRYVECLVMGEETAKTEVEKRVGAQVAKIGFAKAMKNKWLKVSGAKKELVTRTAAEIKDEDQDKLRAMAGDLPEKHDKKEVDLMKKR